MKINKISILSLSLVLYTIFIYLFFPQLKITVMLYSIPVSMLGGWLYSYEGAIGTTLLTVLLHYLMLNYHSDDPQIIMEAFNPFGIISQFIFSGATALLKISNKRYHQLNNSLEDLVAERTHDLEELANYLIDSQNLENLQLNQSLLEKPYLQLTDMLATSELLKQKLKEENHPRAADANNIHMIIESCIKQLRAMDENTLSTMPLKDNIFSAIENMIHQVDQFSDVFISCPPAYAWENIEIEKTQFLSEIIMEAVGNAIRHADAHTIEIQIQVTDDERIVYVDNDGHPLPENPTEGMGLPLMRYRAAKLGGTFSIYSLTDHRTRMECRFP